jgi:Putative prokaryotic signal transducing protein
MWYFPKGPHFEQPPMVSGGLIRIPIPPYNRPMRQSDLVVVEAFASQAEADLAKTALESAGIDAMIQADRAGGMRDHLAWSGFGFKVLVREEDAATARELLHPPHTAPEGKLVVAQICGTQYDAEITQGALESAGIAAAIETATTASAEKRSPLSLEGTVFRVMVREEDAAAARVVVDSAR